MEMLITARSIDAARAASESRATEAEVDQLSQRNFLQHIALANVINIIPFALVAICSLYLRNWGLMTTLIALNAATVLAMLLVSRRLQHCAEEKRQFLWNVYDCLAFVSGAIWAGKMYPVMDMLGRDIVSLFVCVVIIVSIAVTSIVVASQWRTFLSFLAGVMLCLTPQTLAYFDTIGPIPLIATIGLAPALIALAHSMRVQNRLIIRTQLEKQQLADDLAHALAAAEYLANRDSLTGLYNRRAFEDLAGRIRNDGAANPLSLILVDLDHFKSINDQHGHAIGDSVLKKTAELMSNAIGPFDLVGRGDGAAARWGGEEFILLLRNCPLEQAAELAEKLRESLSGLRDPSWSDGLSVTGSFGVVQWQEDSPLHMAINQADAAMYEAKNAGRNRVHLGANRLAAMIL